MASRITIIMYHYVRELEHSRYPGIKGLSVDDFQSQVDYIQKYYNVIGGAQLIESVDNDQELPPRAALLTFDDGYRDHFEYVFPILDAAGVPGCFFPPSKCILERKLLDVNKIHFVLASAQNPDVIIDQVFRLVNESDSPVDPTSLAQAKSNAADGRRYDGRGVAFVKRLLQRELPDALRQTIIDHLFEQFVDVSETVLAEELYMSLDQLRCLHRHGMYIGSHGYNHSWMDCLEPKEQRKEVDKSLAFLEQVGISLDRWMMCYPYGAYNDHLQRYIDQCSCVAALATHVDVADLSRDNRLALPRIDTNDLPVSATAPPNKWTQKVLQ